MADEGGENAATTRKNQVELWGNEKTMNMNPILHTSILSSAYFKEDLYSFKTYHEVIDEIYNRVDHLEPILPGGDNRPSSAFCLLYKLFTLKLTEKQLAGILHHTDSPYIRALGFLYIRFATPPKGLWERFEPYLSDPEPIKVRWDKHAPKISMGHFVRELITEPKFVNTMLPRIPVPVHKDLLEKLKTKGPSPKPDERAVGHGGTMLNGVPDDVGVEGGEGQEGEDGAQATTVEPEKKEASRRSRSPSRSRSQDRRRDSSRDRSRDRTRRRSRSRSRDRRRSRSRSGDRRRRRSRSQSRSKDRRHRSRSRSRDRRRRSRSRSRSRSRDRGHRSDRHRDRRDSDGERRRSRSRDRR